MKYTRRCQPTDAFHSLDLCCRRVVKSAIRQSTGSRVYLSVCDKAMKLTTTPDKEKATYYNDVFMSAT